MDSLEDMHLRVDVGSGKHAKNSGTRRFRGAVQQVRKIIFVRSKFLFKPIQQSFSSNRMQAINDESRERKEKSNF